MLKSFSMLRTSERFKDKLERGLPVYANLLNGQRLRVLIIEENAVLTQCGKSIELKMVSNFD